MAKRKSKVGRVVSNAMEKTTVVAVETFRKHQLYRKNVRRITRYKAHDENNECGVGDVVKMEETRPLSREKRWRIAEIVTRGQVVEVRPEEIEPTAEELPLKSEVVAEVAAEPMEVEVVAEETVTKEAEIEPVEAEAVIEVAAEETGSTVAETAEAASDAADTDAEAVPSEETATEDDSEEIEQ